VADATREALREPVEDLEPAGELEVPGRESSIRLWSLASTRHGHAPQQKAEVPA